MVTTFERLAKVLKGYIKPANWIERAFADLVSAIGSVLPSISNSDRGKFLGVNSSNNNLGWKAIRQVPEVENADKGKYLHANEDTGALEWSEAGGSGGLPSYTVSDKDKVLTVVEETAEAVFVDEQTVTFDSGAGTLAADSYREPSGVTIEGGETCYLDITLGNYHAIETGTVLNVEGLLILNYTLASENDSYIYINGSNAGKVTLPSTVTGSVTLSAYMLVPTGNVSLAWLPVPSGSSDDNGGVDS